MKNYKLIFVFLLLLDCFLANSQEKMGMENMWSEQSVKTSQSDSKQIRMFRDGNYAMFIHWGLYSYIGNIWDGKMYYGISEWIMDKKVANIPVDAYKQISHKFNPDKFDAKKIVSLAKASGMKYIVVTSKHHDGFAMFDTKYDDFNIVKSTPFGRDPMKELSDECKKEGLGFGFYYSQTQDWTAPGGFKGPKMDKKGNPVTFTDYFYNKCLPQIKELCTNYGEITLIWFDTPANIEKKYVKELIDTVKKYQPNTLISGRVGHDLGDYRTLGDMEIPSKNELGLWETVDVTNDSWGFSYSDNNWKTPKEILKRLLSTVARGGTYMLNVGPTPTGEIPEQAEYSLRKAGEWIKKYNFLVYGAGSSPWLRPLPWGDVVVSGGKLYLMVYERPENKIVLNGVKSTIKNINLFDKNQNRIKLDYTLNGDNVSIFMPKVELDEYISVIEVEMLDGIKVQPSLYLDPIFKTSVSVESATIENAQINGKRWMEKFGEWKKVYQISNFTPESSVTWDIEILEPGYYMTSLNYTAKGRMVWKISVNNGSEIINQQNSSHIYTTYPWGWLEFKKAGNYKVTVSLEEGDFESASLKEIIFEKVN